MGRTNIVLDDKLVQMAMRLFGVKTKREAVHLALRTMVERAEVCDGLRRLKGKVRWEGDVDRWRRSRR